MSDAVRTTVIVNSWNKKNVKFAHAKAKAIFGKLVSPVITSPFNGYLTFMIAGSASKADKDPHEAEIAQRKVFYHSLNEISYDNGEAGVDWIEVTFPVGGNPADITNSSDRAERIANVR